MVSHAKNMQYSRTTIVRLINQKWVWHFRSIITCFFLKILKWVAFKWNVWLTTLIFDFILYLSIYFWAAKNWIYFKKSKLRKAFNWMIYHMVYVFIIYPVLMIVTQFHFFLHYHLKQVSKQEYATLSLNFFFK